MTRKEFIKLLHKDVDEFDKMWVDNRDISSDDWPDDLENESEWYDQYFNYKNLR
jgi:hypothetical protein